uniref:Uncharacterized protein n=1 Tax=Ditylenchus dipsaci TaxID=166011 RepID=A0A915E404_9BILA
MESDSDSDVNVFGDFSEEEVSATIRASSERIPTEVVNDAVVRFLAWHRTLNAGLSKRRSNPYWSIHCVIRDEIFVHSKQRFLELFSPTSTRVSRQADPAQISLLQQTVAAFNPANVQMSLAAIVQVAYSSRWGNIAPNQNQTNARLPPIRNIAGISQSPHVRAKEHIMKLRDNCQQVG